MKQIQRQDPTDQELGYDPDIIYESYDLDFEAHCLHLFFKQGNNGHWGFTSTYIEDLPDYLLSIIPQNPFEECTKECEQEIENYADDQISNGIVVCDEKKDVSDDRF